MGGNLADSQATPRNRIGTVRNRPRNRPRNCNYFDGNRGLHIHKGVEIISSQLISTVSTKIITVSERKYVRKTAQEKVEKRKAFYNRLNKNN